MWHDEEKHNALSFIIGGANGFSHENVNILEFIFDQMKPATFKKLLKMKDIYGKYFIIYTFFSVYMLRLFILTRFITG